MNLLSRRRILSLIAATPAAAIAARLPAIHAFDVASFVFVHRARSQAVAGLGEIVVPIGVSTRDPELLAALVRTITEESAVIFAAELRMIQRSSGEPS